MLSSSESAHKTGLFLAAVLTGGLFAVSGRTLAATVADPEFSAERGFYQAPFTVTLTCDTPGAEIRYTTDGTWPSTTHGSGGIAPIDVSITTTTPLRAIAVKTGMTNSTTITHTYVFLADVIRQPSQAMSTPPSPTHGWYSTAMRQNVVDDHLDTITNDLKALPCLSLVADPSGIFSSGAGIMANLSGDDPWGQDWERLCSFEVFNAGSRPDIQVTCGFEIAGASTAGLPKKPLNVLFRSEYGPGTLKYPLIPYGHVESFDSLRLNSVETDKFLDEWVDRLQYGMSGDGQVGTYMHVYINAMYWGVYHVTEKGTRGFGAEHYGGDKDDWDGGKRRLYGFPELDAYDRLHEPERYNEVASLIDLDQYIDFWLLNNYVRHQLWFTEDYEIRCSRQGIPVRFFPWDVESDMYYIKYGAATTNFMCEPKLFDNLYANEEFRIRVADRIHKHLFGDGTLVTNRSEGIIHQMIAEVWPGRWPAVARYHNEFPEPVLLEGYIQPVRTRSGVFRNMLRDRDYYPMDAPSIEPDGGQFHQQTVSVTISQPPGMSSASLYYTTNGTDPRLPGGAVSPDAVATTDNSAQLNIRDTVLLKTRLRQGTAWSPLKEALFRFEQDLSKLKITEVMYHPAAVADVTTYQGLAGMYITVDTNRNESYVTNRVDARLDFDWGTNAPATGVNPKSFKIVWDGYLVPEYTELYTFYVDVECKQIELSIAGETLVQSETNAEFSLSVELEADQPCRLLVRYEKSGGAGHAILRWSSASQGKQVVPADRTFVVRPEKRDFEFIELKNTGSNTLDCSGLMFTDGIRFRFPENTVLLPGKLLVLASNQRLYRDRYPDAPLFGGFVGSLNNNGERITLSSHERTELISFRFETASLWPIAADGAGFSLVAADPTGEGNPSSADYWRCSTAIGGSPGVDDPAQPPLVDVIISEALTHTDLPALDAVELANPNDTTAHVGGWYLSDELSDPKKFRIPFGTTIPPQNVIVLDEDDFNTAPGQPGSFALSALGDAIYVFAADLNGDLLGYSHGFTFGAQFRDVTFGLHRNSIGDERFVARTEDTIGDIRNAPVLVGPVVLNELMYHPPGDGDEYIELLNITDSAVPLFDPAHPTNTWSISGIGYSFPTDLTIPANGLLLVVRTDPTLFRGRYSIPAEIGIVGPYPGKLNNGGESIALRRPDGPTLDEQGLPVVPMVDVDRVEYDDAGRWPTAADGTGASLERIWPGLFGDDPANWQASISTNGTPGLSNPVSEPIDRDLDGMNDYWELVYGLSPWLSADATADTDGDKLTNIGEFIAGTDPLDPRSNLQIADFGPANLSWVSVAGRQYSVWYTDDLTAPDSWQVISNNITGTGASLRCDLPPADAQRFYRVTVTQP